MTILINITTIILGITGANALTRLLEYQAYKYANRRYQADLTKKLTAAQERMLTDAAPGIPLTEYTVGPS